MKRLTVLLVALFAFSLGAYAAEQRETIKKYTQEEWDKKMKELEKQNWSVRVNMEHPGLGYYSGGVLIALVEKDPMENFKKAINKMKKYYIEKSSIKDAKLVAVESAWNDVFETITGGDVALLYNDEKKNDEKRPDHNLSWGGNDFKKQWLVTKAFGLNGKTICWSILLNKKKGKTTEIKLTQQNVIKNEKLEKIYDSIIK